MRIHLPTVLVSSVLALNAVCASGGSVAVVFYNDQFGLLNDATGAYTQVGTLPVSASSGIASMNGLLYLEDMGTNLYTVDPVTGLSSRVGPTGLSAMSGAFAGDSDGLYEVDYGSNLYSINPTTGAAELIGATGLAANNGSNDTSLAASGTSLYYTVGAPGAYDELYELNVLTGLATDLGSTGVTGIAGAAIVGSELELYQYGQGANYIYSAPVGMTNFVQGAQLAAQIIDGGAVIGASASSDQSAATPEPRSACLLALGIVSLTFANRRLSIRKQR